MAIRKALTVSISALIVGALAVGCGGSAASQNKELTLGYLEWTENVAISNLTKVLMEEDLGYQEVELALTDVGPLYQALGSGDIDAFQDSWLPNQEPYLSKVEDDVEVLEPWYQGAATSGLAVPDYVEDVRSIPDLKNSELDRIMGIEAGSAFDEVVRSEVIPGYNLDMELVSSSTTGMLTSLEKAYENKEPIVVVAWKPHWMNERFDLRYLEDPEGLQGGAADPEAVSVTTVVNEDLPEDDPVAHAFLEAISLDEDQIQSLELEIEQGGQDKPEKGVKSWLEKNRDVVQPWLDAAEEVQGS
jgi:glycine betaine/proline transport system substrate-binding protein